MIKKIDFKNTLTLFVLSIILLSTKIYANDEVIKIGSISILSGEGSSWGNAAKNGLQMAVEELNQNNSGLLGKKIEVDYQDDRGEAKGALSAFRHLTDAAKVKFIIGPSFSRCGIPLTKMADDKKIIMISPSIGMGEFNEASKYIFNTWPHDYITSEKLADYVYNKGHRNVALVGAEDPWVKEQTRFFTKRFEVLGGKIAFLTEPQPGTVDLKTEALKLSKTPNVDAFVSTTDGVTIGSLVAKSLKQISFNVPTFSVTLDQAAIDVAQGGFENMEFPSALTPTEEFKNKYEEKFKTEIEIGADSAYDAMMMLADAIEKTGSTDTTIVAAELAKVEEYQGVSGKLTADGKGGFVKGFKMMKVVNGKQVNFD